MNRTDEDYIRKAVELADGWDHIVNTTGPFPCCKTPWDTFHFYHAIPNHDVDALAAQLVRQVDAIDAIYVMSYPDKSAVIDDGLLDVVGIHESPDRTMNTIKAIVDSKVLGNQNHD